MFTSIFDIAASAMANPRRSRPLSPGAIAGIVVGVVFGIVAVLVIVSLSLFGLMAGVPCTAESQAIATGKVVSGGRTGSSFNVDDGAAEPSSECAA